MERENVRMAEKTTRTLLLSVKACWQRLTILAKHNSGMLADSEGLRGGLCQDSERADYLGMPMTDLALRSRFDFVLPKARLPRALLLHEMVLHNRGSGSV